MNRFSPRGLRAGLLAFVTCSFVGCASLGSALPPGLVDTLGQVTGLSSQVTEWSSSLGSMLDDTGLGQLREYASQAGELGTKISSMKDEVSQAMSNPLGAIGGKLQSMSGIDVDGLKSLPQQAQRQALDQFTDSAGAVGGLAESFLKQYGG